eukprot:NODE_390_length_8164_cov_0.195908.p6 type:complete len:138 gc:universal NODE_390_length_8164_cov_0.195908:7170-7583(+)
MARRSRSSSSSRSSRASSSRRAPPAQQQTPAVAQTSQVPSTQQRQPGLLAQGMANIGSVAAGSVIGHGISNAIFGGRHSEPAPQEMPQQQQQNSPFQSEQPEMCKPYQDQFDKCMKESNYNFDGCKYFYDMLKSCQS